MRALTPGSKTKTESRDAASPSKTDEKIDRDLKAALKQGDAKRIAAALKDVVRASRAPPEAAAAIPDGFLRLSEATHLLAQGVWGGFSRPAAVRTLKRQPAYNRTSLGFGPWREEAGKRLRTAATKGNLTVYIFGGAQAAANNLNSSPVVLPSILIGGLISARRNIPDRAIRSSLKLAHGDINYSDCSNSGFCWCVLRSLTIGIGHNAPRANGHRSD